MTVPDKIYIEIDNKAHVYFGLQPENAIEYIRKDALMELLLSLEARYSVFYLQGKVIRDVIDKIDSL